MSCAFNNLRIKKFELNWIENQRTEKMTEGPKIQKTIKIVYFLWSTSFLTTCYGLYFNHQLHITLYKFLQVLTCLMVTFWGQFFFVLHLHMSFWLVGTTNRAPTAYAVVQVFTLYHFLFMIIIVHCWDSNPRPAINLSTKPICYHLSYPGLDTKIM